MAVDFKYWNDCVEPEELQLLWMDADVSKEWIDAGERIGKKVHISRDPDGQLYLTQTEMRAVAEIVINKHFQSQFDVDMICAIAEIGSDRQLLAERYDRKTKETRIGIMQLMPTTAEWLVSEMGYRNYEIAANLELLYRPLVSVYFGAAYIKWLSNYDGKVRNEEFVARAYKGGVKKATHKSTLDYFRRYLLVKESLPSRGWQVSVDHSITQQGGPISVKSGSGWTYWDSRVSREDMDDLWKHPDVVKEWTKSNEKQGKVRFSHDAEKRPYLSRVEVKAVAEIIVSRYFDSKGAKPSGLAALAELSSMRFVNGLRACTGLMGIDYPTAVWLRKDIGYKAYQVSSVDDLYNPFISMYFGAAYLAWLSEYEGRERSHQFIIQAYLGGGPGNVNIQETAPLWNKFQEMLTYYEDQKKEQGSCSIL